MRPSTCAELAERRSALVDGALTHADRERVLAHLVSCAACRSEVAELRELRRLLTTQRDTVPTPPSLSSQLVSIGTAPRRRVRRATRRLGRRIAIGGIALLTATGVAIGAGYLAAPAPPAVATARVGDPALTAGAEFSAALTSLPLGVDAVASVLSAGADLRVNSFEATRAGTGTGAELSAGQAFGLLERAVAAEDTLSYTGTQRVWMSSGDHSVAAGVRVEASAGQGSRLQVFSRAGQWVRTDFARSAMAGSRMVDSELLALLGRRYQLSGRAGATVASRQTSVVAARPLRSGLGGAAPERGSGADGVLARWWVDDATGLLLRLETYGPDGALTLAAGYASLGPVGPSPSPVSGSTFLAAPATTASLTVSSAPALSNEGWFCADRVAGLPLVRLRRGAPEHAALHLVYSDGVQTVSVFEQRGVLPEALPGWQRDEQLPAYVRPGALQLATWQSGDTVFTAATSGSQELLAVAVRALPGEATAERTTMERVRAGWARILAPLAPH